MKIHWPTPKLLAGWTALLGGCVCALFASACYLAEVEGDVAAGGCPSGERCSGDTPDGLTFIGAYLFDSSRETRLGPVIAGGTFDLGFISRSDFRIERYRFQIEDSSHLTGDYGQGTFGPLNETTGEPMYETDGFVRLRGVRGGNTFVRIIDPDTGELYDRLELEVLPIQGTRLVNAHEPEREVLFAGEDELLGIRLLVHNGSEEIRAIDQSIEFHADGAVQPELMYWDCFKYTVPTDRTEMHFVVVAAGQTHEHTLPIVQRPAEPL